MVSSLVIRAGETARNIIAKQGLDLSRIKVIVGASGGPKWLAISRLDQFLFPKLLEGRKTPLYSLGSSIGAWRLSCLGRKNPSKAVKFFEENYVEETWDGPLSRLSLANYMRLILQTMIGPDGLKEILNHEWVRMNILAVRAKGLIASRNDAALGLGLLCAFLGNAMSRKALALFFERALFCDPRSVPPFAGAKDLPMFTCDLTDKNLYDAVLATSSIPFVCDAISPIDGAPQGAYRDGGFTDYHFDMPFLSAGETTDDSTDLILYLHYRDRLIPAWMDKLFPWRKPNPKHLERVVMIAPSDAFIQKLPHKKIPDRGDFKSFPHEARKQYWKTVLSETDKLVEDLSSIVESETLANHVIPFH